MRIAVFGLGYVGSVTSVCLTLNGHEVWGVDEHALKVDWISRGIPPLNEPRFAEELKTALASGRFQVTTDAARAIRETEAALICVGTPSMPSGATDLTALRRVLAGFNAVLMAHPHPYLIAVRSTIPPGTMQDVVIPTLRDGAMRVLGDSLRVCFNPEFLREGTAIDDFFAPPFTVVGAEGNPETVEAVLAAVERMYVLPGVPVLHLNLKEAELVKVISNAYHAMKINFANEVGIVAAKVGADPIRLMDAFCQDTKLNISAKYLRPGFAFGGSCLPKDVRGLIHVAHAFGLNLPLMQSILPSNDAHLQRALDLLLARPVQVIGLVGAVFKSDTDDLRESPALSLARALIDAGRRVLIFEPEIQLDRLVGANLHHLESCLPEYRQCFCTWPALQAEAQLIAISRPGVVPAPGLAGLGVPIVRLHQLADYQQMS